MIWLRRHCLRFLAIRGPIEASWCAQLLFGVDATLDTSENNHLLADDLSVCLLVYLFVFRLILPSDTPDGKGYVARIGAPGPSSAALAPGCCRRHILDYPSSQQPKIQEWLQKNHRQLLGCAGRSSAALAPACCLRRILDCPRSQQPRIQEWLQTHHRQLLGCAGTLLSCS